MASENSFKTIYTAYFARIKTYMVRLIGPQHAEDAVQDVFGKVHKHLHTLEQGDKLSAWMYRIAANTAIDHTRTRSFSASRDTKDVFESPFQDQNAWTGEPRASTDRRLIREEMSACVREFVDRLPADYKTALVLKDYEGRKNGEIAEILNLSIHNVKIRLHRARRMLKKELDEGCTFYHDDENRLMCDRKPPLNKTKKI